MKLSRFAFGLTAAVSFGLLSSLSPVVRMEAQAQGTQPAQPHKWQAELPDQPEEPKDAKKKPLVSLFNGLGKELGASADGMGKDMILIFSVQDEDPYEKKAPTDRPYELLTFRLIDGSRASLIKYPDGSGKINGGYADGTVIIPQEDREYLVKYPNGARGKLKLIGSDLIKVYRPDKTVTTFKKGMSGGYSITNDKLGYMGEATTDQTGLRYEFK